MESYLVHTEKSIINPEIFLQQQSNNLKDTFYSSSCVPILRLVAQIQPTIESQFYSCTNPCDTLYL